MSFRLPARITRTLIPLVPALLVAACAGCRESSESDRQPAAPMAQGDVGQVHCYWTWDVLEFDKCAAAWLITRFYDERAVIQIHARGTHNAPGAPFDVPRAEWIRTARASCTEHVLEAFGSDDPALEQIAEHARRIELARWMLEEFPESRHHYEQVQAIIEATPDPYECLEKTNAYFDALYAKLSAPGTNEAASCEQATSEPSRDVP